MSVYTDRIKRDENISFGVFSRKRNMEESGVISIRVSRGYRRTVTDEKSIFKTWDKHEKE